MIPQPVLSLFLSLAAGLVLVPLVRHLAIRCSIVAEPRPDRWHRRTTALLGGLAIWGAVAASMICYGPKGPALVGVLVGGSLLCAFGLFDDLRHVKPASKLVAQIVAAAIAISVGFHISWFRFEILNLAASFFWIVAITNAVNLLDHMDGLAAGVVLIAAQSLGWSFTGGDQIEIAVLAFSLVGALAAFLVYNVHPASIFMGDCGSMFIGFTLACLALADHHASQVLSFVAVPAMTLTIPILDTTLVTVTRLLSGRSIAEGGQDHTSHRLVMLGLSERQAVALLWFLALAAGGFAALTSSYSYSLGMGLLPLIIAAFGLLGVFLSRLSFVDPESGEIRRETNGFVRLALEIPHKRRILEVILDFVLVFTAYYLAYGLCFGFELENRRSWPHFHQSLPIVIAAAMVAFFLRGVYRGVWRSVSIDDVFTHLQACVLASLLGMLGLFLALGVETNLLQVFALYTMLAFLGVGASRVSLRLIDEPLARRRPGRSTRIVRAGNEGEIEGPPRAAVSGGAR